MSKDIIDYLKYIIKKFLMLLIEEKLLEWYNTDNIIKGGLIYDI